MSKVLMASSELKSLVEAGDLGAIETRILETLSNSSLKLAEIVTTFRQLEQHPENSRVANLAQVVLDNSDSKTDPGAALAIARVGMIVDPSHAELRKRIIALYRDVHGENPGFTQLFEASGLETGRPARSAIKMLEMGLAIAMGDPLISRTEDSVVEITGIDHAKGLITVRREGRTKTLTTMELSREFERADSGDFRVLRALKPDALSAMIQNEPVKVVIGLLHSHGGELTADELKAELVPKYIQNPAWTGWWTSTRTKLKKDPHISMQGRSPVVLTYTKTARTVEDDVWDKFISQNEPDHWLSTVESYLRDRKAAAEPVDKVFLERCHAHIVAYIKAIKAKRPAEAMACALVTQRIDDECGLSHSDVKNLEIEMLKASEKPSALISQMTDAALWEGALAALVAARPDDAATVAVELLPKTPANVLDSVADLAVKGGFAAEVQSAIDGAMADPHKFPELIYWMWKSVVKIEGVKVPPASDLFTRILQTLSTLGRTLNPPADMIREFRGRMRTALALRDFGLAKTVLSQTSADRAVTLKTQLDRLDGLGDNTRIKLLDLLRDVHPQLWIKHEKRIEVWADVNVVWTTRAGLQRKTEERETLVNVTMRDNARRIGEAAQLGDLSENSEYKFALEERDFLRARLAQMNNEMSIAEVIEPAGVPTERIGIGSRAKLRNVLEGTERTLTFLGPFDGDLDQGIYNYKAPSAQKFMGLKVGDHLKVSLEGPDVEYEIVSIENGLA
ncbi:MAG: GreA/GreB family elongation factor [Phycisphaerae bacterium]